MSKARDCLGFETLGNVTYPSINRHIKRTDFAVSLSYLR